MVLQDSIHDRVIDLFNQLNFSSVINCVLNVTLVNLDCMTQLQIYTYSTYGYILASFYINTLIRARPLVPPPPESDMKKDIETLIAEERADIIIKYDKVRDWMDFITIITFTPSGLERCVPLHSQN